MDLMKRNPGTSEYDKFSQLLKRVVSVPHSEIKAKLDAEKAQRKPKRGTRSKNDPTK